MGAPAGVVGDSDCAGSGTGGGGCEGDGDGTGCRRRDAGAAGIGFRKVGAGADGVNGEWLAAGGVEGEGLGSAGSFVVLGGEGERGGSEGDARGIGWGDFSDKGTILCAPDRERRKSRLIRMNDWQVRRSRPSGQVGVARPVDRNTRGIGADRAIK